MRGDDQRPDDLFSYIRPEQRVPADHPLRPIRAMVDTVCTSCPPSSPGCMRRRAGRRSRPRSCCGPSCSKCVLGPERAAADGAARLQPALPLVRRAEHG